MAMAMAIAIRRGKGDKESAGDSYHSMQWRMVTTGEAYIQSA